MSQAPLAAESAALISFINNGGNRRLHPDFGGEASPGSVAIYGFPYIVVDGNQPKKTVQFQYSDESDGVNHDRRPESLAEVARKAKPGIFS